MPDFFGRMVGLMNIEANTNLLNAEAQGQQVLAKERELNLQLGRQKLQDDMIYQQALRDTASGTNGTQQQGDQAEGSLGPLAQAVMREDFNAQHLRQVANVMQSKGVSLGAQKQAEAEAEAASKSALAAHKEYRTEQTALMDQIGRIAGAGLASNSREGMLNAFQQIKQIDPQLARTVFSDINRDDAGIPKLDDKSRRALDTLKYQGMNTATMMLRDQQAAEQARREEELQRERDRDKEMQRWHNAEVAVRRMGIEHSDKRHEDTLKAAGLKYDRTLVDKTQKEIDKTATDAKLGDFKAAADVASRVQSKLVDPAQGYTSVTPEDARQLVEQAKRLQQNFRSFGSAGKLQESEIRSMNSFQEGYEKWVQSVGSGDPILAKDQMLNLTETMKNVYTDRNAEQVKQELQRKNVLAQRGNNPNWVIPRGNIDDLKESGRAYEVTVDNKQYLAIIPAGKTNKQLTKNDLYEIPQPPKMPTFIENTTLE